MRTIINARINGTYGRRVQLREGVVTAIGGEEIQPEGEVIDACGADVIAGLIDTHVHFREPGMESKGNIASESRAAVVGGVTSFIDMPNTMPATLTAAALADKYKRAALTSAANYGFFLGASENTVSEVARIPRHRLPGIKLFMGTTTGAVATPSASALDAIFRMCAEMGLPIVVHAEDDALIAANAAAVEARYGSREAVPVSEHAIIRSREACLRATAKAVELATRFGAHLHIAHVSTADEVREFLSAGPVDGKLITAETTPMYMDPLFGETTWRTKINPAIKGEADAAALREAVIAGKIDTIGTDHAPHLREHKQGGEFKAASGAPSLQFALPVMLEYLPLKVIERAMGSNPAKIFGIQGRGALEVGMKVEPVLVHRLSEPMEITDGMVTTPAGWTPFAGRAIHHRVETLSFKAGELKFG